MQALEYYFNPRLRKDTQFRVFSFKPDDSKKKYLGNLYLIVEYNNALPRDDSFLEELIDIIHEEFYSNPKRLPEIALKEALKKGNQFLNKQSKAGNVSWLGNLNIAVLNVSNFFLYFSKAGNIKILLLRDSELTDIAEDLELQASGLPFKFFSNIASGRSATDDRIMVLTNQLFEEFYDKILTELINLPEIKDKTLKKFFRERKKEMKKWSGIFFLISIDKQRIPLGVRLHLSRPNKTLLLILSFLALLLISLLVFR